jgi:hypothetical protein
VLDYLRLEGFFIDGFKLNVFEVDSSEELMSGVVAEKDIAVFDCFFEHGVDQATDTADATALDVHTLLVEQTDSWVTTKVPMLLWSMKTAMILFPLPLPSIVKTIQSE